MKVPPFLKKRDKVAIVAPAGNIPGGVLEAVSLLESWGLQVMIGESVHSFHHQFAGDDTLRASDFQRMLDDPDVKAVIAARGGYGTVRIIDQIDFSGFAEHPKWIIGFSDITVLHGHIQALSGIPTLHAQMPLNIPDATRPSLESLRRALFGDPLSYQYESRLGNRNGTAEGILTGGNLAILVSIAGSVSEPDYAGKILFIEDVGEHYYSVDRMIRMMKRAGKLRKLQGLIIGGFTAMQDKEVSFGATAEEIILDAVSEYDYPIATGFPAGHIENNHTLILGKKARLQVNGESVSLNYVL